MAERKREEVTASFHYLVRVEKLDNGKRRVVPFSNQEFDALATKISGLLPLDLDDPAIAELVRLRAIAPLSGYERIDQRTVYGTFDGAYSGHAYRTLMLVRYRLIA